MNHITIKKETSLEGKGIHSGLPVRLLFKPAPADTGIVFRRVDLSPAVDIPLKDFEFVPQDRCTAIAKGAAQVFTIEHLMAALWALSITDIIVEVSNAEMPALDGSAIEYYKCLMAAGTKELDVPIEVLKIEEPVWVEKNDAFIGVFPSQTRTVSYLFESPSPALKRQSINLPLDKEVIAREVLMARTFCLKEEAQMLLKMGFGKGADTNNTLVMDINGPIDNKLRYEDEPVRHKMLDLIGDLYTTGRPIEGRIIGIKSGHELNRLLAKQLMTKGW